MGSQVVEIHQIPPELQAEMAALFPGLSYEEALQHQECLYQSWKTSCSNLSSGTSGPSFRETPVSFLLGESSLSGSTDIDLDLDEAVARSLQELQELEEGFENVSISEPGQSISISRNMEAASRSSSAVERNQDDIDPDQMSYEELQSLGDAIGAESRGLSERDISMLPSSKYKTGLFSKKGKGKDAECVICYSSYENRQKVTTLPCLHQYHAPCINRWLRLNKVCPICQKEVKLF